MQRTVLIALFVFAGGPGLLAAEPARAPLPMPSPLQDKNFYLISLWERAQSVRLALHNHPALQRIHAAKVESLKKASSACGVDLKCHTSAMMWTDAEVAAATKALRDIHASSEPMREFVANGMRASGVFQLHSALSGEDLLGRAWRDAAAAMNRIIEVYGEGAAPRYPAIDSVAYDVTAPNWSRLVHVITAVLNEEASELNPFYRPTLRFALRLMEASRRDEAARFEPLPDGENSAAYLHIRSIRWTDYPYPAIVVPGSGPDRPEVSLSPWGKERLRLAAHRYRNRKAPLLIVSGGFVHPNQTPHAEAIEMKKSLMKDFGIPEQAILVDPHARHTTTNLRNAARLMWRYGIPFDRPSLITTDPFQSQYIESAAFGERCQNELGYQPHALKRRVSDFDLEFVPRIESLHADATDPLDP